MSMPAVGDGILGDRSGLALTLCFSAMERLQLPQEVAELSGPFRLSPPWVFNATVGLITATLAAVVSCIRGGGVDGEMYQVFVPGPSRPPVGRGSCGVALSSCVGGNNLQLALSECH